VRAGVPSWDRAAAARSSTVSILRSHWRLGIYAVVLMAAFNFFSHGTQDLYPTFLQVQHALSPHAVGTIAAIYNVGAIVGGILCGSLSERLGRRRMIVTAALLSLPVLPLWAFSASPVLLAIGAFLMQAMVQGAWGVIPAHLNELSPDEAAAPFPASSTSSAICWQRRTRRSRPASPCISAATTAWRLRSSPAALLSSLPS